MYTQKLVDLVAFRSKETKATTKKVLDSIIDTIIESYERGDTVDITGFGSFYTTLYKRAGKKVNFKGKTFDCKDAKILRFRVSQVLQDRVNHNQ